MPIQLPKNRISTKAGVELDLSPLAAGDESLLAAFAELLCEETKRKFAPHPYDIETIREYVRRNEGGDDAIFVAKAPDGAIVGYFFLWEITAPVPVLGLGIADAFQGVGVGRQLMLILIHLGQEMGKAGIDLTTLRDNDRAFRLYQSVGFEYVGDVANVAGDGRRLVERRMFLPLRDGAIPPERKFSAPV